jgi:hypothetical protein
MATICSIVTGSEEQMARLCVPEILPQTAPVLRFPLRLDSATPRVCVLSPSNISQNQTARLYEFDHVLRQTNELDRVTA